MPAERRTEVVVDTLWQAFSSPTSMAALESSSPPARRDNDVNTQIFTSGHRNREPHLGNATGNSARPEGFPQPLDTTGDRRTLVDVRTTYSRAQRN